MKARSILTIDVLLTVLVIGVLLYFTYDWRSKPKDTIDIKAQLNGARDGAFLHKDDKGELKYQVTLKDDKRIELSPQEWSQRLYDEGNSRPAWEVYLNISSAAGLAWVGLGLLGQVLFTGRMVVQLLASQKEGKSVVPPAFWWMSLIGATMLLIYFAWRRDPVGILGQGVGWFVYVKNLWLIYSHKPPEISDAPVPTKLADIPDEAEGKDAEGR